MFYYGVVFQDVGQDHAWEVRRVVLPLPRRQLHPEKRQEHFPRAQGFSFRASPNPVMCPIFTASSLLIFLYSPKRLNNEFSQSTSPRKHLSSVAAKKDYPCVPDILSTTPGLPGLTVLGQGDEYKNKHKDPHSSGSAGK